MEAIHVIGNGEYIRKNRPLGIDAKAAVLILGSNDTNINQSELEQIYLMLLSTERFTLGTLFYINRLTVSN